MGIILMNVSFLFYVESVPVLAAELVQELFQRIPYTKLLEMVEQSVLITVMLWDFVVEFLEFIYAHADFRVTLKGIVRKDNGSVNGSISETAFFEVVDDVVDVGFVLEFGVIELVRLCTDFVDEILAASRNTA